MRLVGLVVGLIVLLTPLAATAQDRVGAATLIEIGAVRVPAGQPPLQLSLSDSVFFQDVVSTAPEGALRVTFLDGSTLDVGPDSDVTVDRFVFVPGGNRNGLAIDASQGMFRFASGLLDDRNIQVTTPTATLGVRGTIFNLFILPGRGELIQALVGTTILSVGGQTFPVAPGSYAFVSPNGEVTIGQVAGNIRPMLQQFGLAFPPGALTTFFRFAGQRSFVRYADVIGGAGFPEDWWRNYCSAWNDDDGAASDELDDDLASGCGLQRGPNFNDDDDDDPDSEPYQPEDDNDCTACDF